MRDMPDPVREAMYGENDLQTPGSLGSLTPIGGGGAGDGGPHQIAINQSGVLIITRQAIDPRLMRDETRIRAMLRADAARLGPEMYYSWEQKDRRRNRKVTIEGPSIVLTDTVLRRWGNYILMPKVDFNPEFFIITPTFVDLETGANHARPFIQRRSQNMGMGDDGDEKARQLDLVFQIGVSKATRNVIVHALSDVVRETFYAAKEGLANWIAKDDNLAKAQAMIDAVMEEEDIDLLRVEAVVGRKRAKWTPADYAAVLSQMRAIKDKFADPDAIYPTKEDAVDVVRETAERGDTKRKREPKETSAGSGNGGGGDQARTDPLSQGAPGAGGGEKTEPGSTPPAADATVVLDNTAARIVGSGGGNTQAETTTRTRDPGPIPAQFDKSSTQAPAAEPRKPAAPKINLFD